MKKGFLIGKFYPFHLGHAALMQEALQHCDRLRVLVCAAASENISGQQRATWIRSHFAQENRISVEIFHYDETLLPNTSASSQEVSRIWANALKPLMREEKFIFSSEPYGDFVAECMNIQHIRIKDETPIRATRIRENPYKHWDYIPDSVKPYYQKKIVLLGTESTGKTTLTDYLCSQIQGAIAVYEAGRDIVGQSEQVTSEDITNILAEHTRRIHAAEQTLAPFIIIDTDWQITLSYSRFFLHTAPPISDDIRRTHKANLYLYLNAEAPYIQDGTRLPLDLRNALDLSHRAVLEEMQTHFIEITGADWTDRQQQAIEKVKSEK